MIDTNISVTFSNKEITADFEEDERWIWIEEEGQEDITSRQLADVLDALFELDACGSESENNLVEEEDPYSDQTFEVPKYDWFTAVIKDHFDLDICNYDYNNNYWTKIRVYRSHSDEDYVLRVGNGSIEGTEVVKEKVEGNLSVDKATSVKLKYPIVKNESVEYYWRTYGVNSFGLREIVPIKLVGTTLTWEGEMTGSIFYRYTTVYDRVEIIVYSDEDDNPAESHVLALYNGLYDEIVVKATDTDAEDVVGLSDQFCGEHHSKLEVHNDDSVSCYVVVTKRFLCQCGQEVHHTIEVKERADCPEGLRCEAGNDSCSIQIGARYETGGYVRCANDSDYKVNKPEYYEEKCCEPWPFYWSMPQCKSIYSLIMPSQGLSPATQRMYQNVYDEVRFIPLYPEKGYCGKQIISQDVKQADCCIEAPLIFIDEDYTPDVISPGSSIAVIVVSGKRPYTVQVRGSGFWLNSAHTLRDASTTSNIFIVYADSEACGSATILINDGCNSDSTAIRSTVGRWDENNTVLYCGEVFTTPYNPPQQWTYTGMFRYWSVAGRYCYTAYESLQEGYECGQKMRDGEARCIPAGSTDECEACLIRYVYETAWVC